MECRRNLFAAEHRNIARQVGVERRYEALGGDAMLRAEVTAIRHRMHARIRAAASSDCGTHACDSLHSILHTLLHSYAIGLNLPAVIFLPVKAQGNKQIAHKLPPLGNVCNRLTRHSREGIK